MAKKSKPAQPPDPWAAGVNPEGKGHGGHTQPAPVDEYRQKGWLHEARAETIGGTAAAHPLEGTPAHVAEAPEPERY